MKRKIVLLGKSTYVTSLPSKWVREHSLEKGDYLEVEEKEEKIIISTQKISPQVEISFDVSSLVEKTIGNVLYQAYRRGFDKLNIKYENKEQLEIIKKLVRNKLLGFEVINETKETCSVENITEPSSDKYEIILRKLFHLVKNEAEEILKNIKENDFEKTKREDNTYLIDMYTNFIRRLIIKNKIDGKNSYLTYYAISQLSLIHHAHYYIFKKLAEEKTKLPPKLVLLLQETIDLFDLYTKSFFKRDMKLAHKIQLKKETLFSNKIFPYLKKEKGNNNLVLYHIGEIVRLIQMSSTNIFGIAVNE